MIAIFCKMILLLASFPRFPEALQNLRFPQCWCNNSPFLPYAQKLFDAATTPSPRHPAAPGTVAQVKLADYLSLI